MIRSELQGLRALAVIFVITNHAFPNYLPGGFIGVDIFFVLSGYLITLMLLETSNKKFTTYLKDFYSRRIRRILPSALLVILVSTIASSLLLGPVVASDTARDGIWASLFLANIHFNNLSIDYFQSELPLPILQHYWSLAIEEQFYLIWPILLYVFLRKGLPIIVGIGLVTFASLIYSIIELINSAPTAYFGTLTRFWELGIGAILALRKIPQNRFISTTSLGLLILLAFIYSSQTQFPGVAALAVTTLTASFIATSTSNSTIAAQPFVYVGNISYLLYLWHWPILQISRLYTEVTGLITALLVTATFLMSILTHHLFEKPIRYSQLLTKSNKRTLFFGLFGTSITLLTMVSLR